MVVPVSPVMIPDRLHFGIAGMTGSGKTQRYILPYLLDSLERAARWRDRSCVLLDGKPDWVLRHALIKKARRLGIQVRFFTNQLGVAHNPFNPLCQSLMMQLPVRQRTWILMRALGLLSTQHRMEELFFETQSKRGLIRLLKMPEARSLRRLYELTTHAELLPTSEFERKLLAGVFASLETYTEPDGINVCPEDVPKGVRIEPIELLDIFREPTLLILHCDVSADKDLALFMGGITMNMLAAGLSLIPQSERLHVECVVDEAARFVDRTDLGEFLAMSKGKGLTVGLGYQSSTSDFKTADGRLEGQIKENLGWVVTTTANTVEQRRELIENSGEALAYRSSYTSGPTGSSVSETESMEPRIDKETSIGVSVDNNLAFLTINDPTNDYQRQYAGRPITIHAPFCMSEKKYNELKIAPKPSGKEAPGLVICTRDGLVFCDQVTDATPAADCVVDAERNGSARTAQANGTDSGANGTSLAEQIQEYLKKKEDLKRNAT